MILDTTILVDLLRGDARAMDRVGPLEAQGEVLWVPTPALFERWECVERSDRPDPERGRALGETHPPRLLDPIDAEIAGMALAEGLAVLTRNVKHFERAGDLKVET